MVFGHAPFGGGGLSQTALGLVGRYAFPPDSTTSKDGSSQLLSGLHSQRHLSPCRNNCPGRTLVENQSEVALACLLPCRSDVPFIAPAVHHQCHLAATSQIWRDFPLLFVSFSFLIFLFHSSYYSILFILPSSGFFLSLFFSLPVNLNLFVCTLFNLFLSNNTVHCWA